MKINYIIKIIIACASMALLPSHAQQVIVKDGYTTISAEGYIQGMQSDNSFVDVPLNSLTATEKVKRKKRHVRLENKYISPLFAIAPTDIDVTGTSVAVLTPMTWAQAAGWTENANTTGPLADQFALKTGCPEYKGKDGTDNSGSWRIPTNKELHLMNLLKTAMDKTSTSTGFQPYFAKRYWTSTETDEKSACDQEVRGLPNSGTATKVTLLPVRCVKDLPVP